VTFTINGAPYTPVKVESEIEKIKLPDLPQIPLPKLSNLSDPRVMDPRNGGSAEPRDPRRRLSQSTYPTAELTVQLPLWQTAPGMAGNTGSPATPTRKKISISEYLKKSEKPEPTVKPNTQSNAVLPVIYGPEV